MATTEDVEENLYTHGVLYSKPRKGSKRTQAKNALDELRPFDGNWPAPPERRRQSASEMNEEWKYYDKYPYENLVFSAGGSKGIGYVGAIAALDEAGILHKVKRFAGCSVGSLTATLVAIGCPAEEMISFGSYSNDCNKYLLEDQCCPLLCLGPKLIRSFGLHPMKRLYKRLGGLLEKKVGNKDITFCELYRKFDRELVIVATNLSAMREEYFGKDTSPNMPIREAIRMSVAIPGAYEPHIRTVAGKKMLYVDGAMLNDYPLHCFDEVKKRTTLTRGLNIHKDQTLGFYLVYNGLKGSVSGLQRRFSETICARKMWKERYGDDAPEPSKPTYTPYTKLFRNKLGAEYKRKAKQDPKLKRTEVEPRMKNPLLRQYSHFQVMSEDNIEIRNIGEYLDVVIHTMIAHQRGPECKVDDIHRTVAINCGYFTGMETVVETEDMKFLIDQGYEKTRQHLIDYVQRHDKRSRPPSVSTLDAVFETPRCMEEEEEEAAKSEGFDSLFTTTDFNENSPLLLDESHSPSILSMRRRSLLTKLDRVDEPTTP